jgi:hypothetical protein
MGRQTISTRWCLGWGYTAKQLHSFGRYIKRSRNFKTTGFNHTMFPSRALSVLLTSQTDDKSSINVEACNTI